MESKLKLPKSVYLRKDKLTKPYTVNIHSKKYNKNIHVGYFDTIEESMIARDKFVVENYHDLTSGYLPRGISFDERRNKFTSTFTFNKTDIYLGSFVELKDAIEFRNKYIDSLK